MVRQSGATHSPAVITGGASAAAGWTWRCTHGIAEHQEDIATERGKGWRREGGGVRKGKGQRGEGGGKAFEETKRHFNQNVNAKTRG